MEKPILLEASALGGLGLLALTWPVEAWWGGPARMTHKLWDTFAHGTCCGGSVLQKKRVVEDAGAESVLLRK